jgi:uncharacterized protein involved in outer membrane biogenesis
MRRRTLRTIALALLALVVGGAAVLVVVAGTIDWNRYKGLVATRVTEATGRTLEVRGDLRLTLLSFVPSLRIEGVSLANASWGSAPRMLKVRRLEAQVALLPLLKRQVLVKRLVLVEPEILLETDARGRRNWDVFPGKSPQAPAPANGRAPTLHVREVRVKEGRLAYRDGASGRTTTVRIDRLSVLARSLDGPLRLTASGAWNGQAAEAKATLGSLAALLRNDALAVAATAKAAGAELDVEGSLGRPLEGEGLDLAVRFKAGSLRDLSRLAGHPLPPLGPIHLTARVSEEQGPTFRVRDLRLTIGGSDLAGELLLALEGRPRVSGRLASRLLDLADLAPPDPAAAPAETARKLFPEAPLPVAEIRGFDAHLSLAADRVRTQAVVLEQVALQMALGDGRLAVSPLRLRLAGGAVTGELALDARPSPPRLTARVEARQVDTGRLLEEVGRKNVLSGGKLDATLELSGRGDTLRAVLAGGDGRALFTMGEGRIENSAVDRFGADLVTELSRALDPFSRQETAMRLRCAVLRLDVKQGIATTNRGLAIETQRVNVVGAGAASLGTEELDLALRAQAREGLALGAGSLTQLVRVRGTLAAPKLELSPEGLVKVGASVGAAVATGGISLLAQGLFQRITADSAPCATALSQTPPGRPASPGDPHPAAAPEPSPREGGLGGFLKGFLGRLDRLGTSAPGPELPPDTYRERDPSSP